MEKENYEQSKNPIFEKERNNHLRSGERIVSPSLEQIETWHLNRYEILEKYVRGKVVLDVGCGCGFGSYIMSKYANKVIGIDIAPDAIVYANKYWSKSNIEFLCDDFLKMEEIPQIDIIVALELLEHLSDPQLAFEQFKKSKASIIVITVPHITTPFGGNKFHFRHYGMDEILNLFLKIGYKPLQAEIKYFRNSFNVFYAGERIWSQ